MAQGDRVTDFKVYTLSDLSGIRYVGITSCSLPERLSKHFAQPKFNNPYKWRWIQKHREEITITEVQNSLSLEEAEKQEIELIKCYREQGYKLVNIADGGRVGRKGAKHSPESIQKMSQVKRGKTLSPEHKKKIGDALRGKKTGVISYDRKQKLSIAHKGIKTCIGFKHSEETKSRMSLGQKQRAPFSLEHRIKLAEATKRYRERKRTENAGR